MTGDLSAGYDPELQLELAEHGLLLSLGFWWATADDGSLIWCAPHDWPGSSEEYGSRAHAINSWRKHVAGVGRGSEAYGRVVRRRRADKLYYYFASNNY